MLTRRQSNILQVFRLTYLGVSSAYLVQLGYRAYLISVWGMGYWQSDWGMTHGEPFIIIFLGLAVFTEALLPYFFRLDWRKKKET